MSDYNLYGGHPPHQKHSRTSKAAATSIKKKIGPTHRKIIAFLDASGRYGATDEEMQEQLKLSPNTQRPRRVELQAMGEVMDSGLTASTRSGRQAVVWVSKMHSKNA